MSPPWWDGGDCRLMMSSQERGDWSVHRSLSASIPGGSLFEKYGFNSLPTVLWAFALASRCFAGGGQQLRWQCV